MVLARPPNFQLFQPPYQGFGIVPSIPVTLVITVTLMFLLSSKVQVIVSPFVFFDFHSMVRWDGKVHYSAGSLSFSFFFLLSITKAGLLSEITQSQRTLCVPFSRNKFWLVLISFVTMIKFQFLAQFSVDIFPTQSCLVLYSFCATLLHSLIMWLIVLLSPHNLHLLFLLHFIYFRVNIFGPYGVVLEEIRFLS